MTDVEKNIFFKAWRNKQVVIILGDSMESVASNKENHPELCQLFNILPELKIKGSKSSVECLSI